MHFKSAYELAVRILRRPLVAFIICSCWWLTGLNGFAWIAGRFPNANLNIPTFRHSFNVAEIFVVVVGIVGSPLLFIGHKMERRRVQDILNAEMARIRDLQELQSKHPPDSRATKALEAAICHVAKTIQVLQVRLQHL